MPKINIAEKTITGKTKAIKVSTTFFGFTVKTNIPETEVTSVIPAFDIDIPEVTVPPVVIPPVIPPVVVPPIVPPVVIPPTTTTRKIFKSDSFYNKKLADNTPIHANSAGLVAELLSQTVPGAKTPYYGNVNSTDFTSALYIIKDVNTPKIPVIIRQNGADADWAGDLFTRCKAGLRIPTGIDGNPGTDGAVAIWDQVDDLYYDFWKFKPYINGQYEASFGGIIYDVSNSDGIFPDAKNKWGTFFPTGCTATSLPLMGGMIKAEEMKNGVIPHCLGFAIPQGPNSFVWPARRTDGGGPFFEGPNAIKAGQRFRFPADIVIDPNWIPLVKMMVIAIRDYGCVVQDRAGAVCFYAENTARLGVPNSTDQYRKKADGTSMAGWQFMNPNYFPYPKLQAIA